jgi:RNA polymerase sigma factor (sigma-70 family)
MANVKLRSAVRHLRRLVAEPKDRNRTDGELLRAFVSSNDQPSFAQVVKRHGPMVLSVCRRVLHREQDAEDAFQATFLLLARKASAIRKQESLGSWLHGVAYHMATDARKAAARRRRRENEATSSRQAPDPARAAAWREVQAILDEEIGRLPAVYREPFVLCCLEGQSCAEAAARLGQKEGTVWSRVARARQRLQRRLTRRGVCLTTALGAAAVAGNTALSAVPPSLLGTTVEAAAGLASGVVSPRVAALLKAGARAMFLGRVKALMPLLLAVGLTAGLSFAAARPGASEPPVADPPAGRKADAPEARTDRHGDPLPAEALARLGTVRFRHAEQITSLAFTPDGKRLVSHGGDGLRAWEVATGREVASAVTERDGWSEGALLTRDGKSVVAHENRPNSFVVCVRGASDLKVLREFAVDRPYLLFRVSPDGKYLAGARDSDGTIDLWDVASGKQIRSWNGHDRRVWTLQFSADGKTLVTCGEDKAIRFWDVASGKQERAITGYPDIVGAFALSPDGTRLATVGMTESSPGVGTWPRASQVRLWDVVAGKEVGRLRVLPPKDTDHVADLVFTPDGKALVTAGPDDKVHFWDPADGKEQHHLDLGEWPGAIALSPKGETLAVAVGGRTVRLLDLAGGRDAVTAGGHHREIVGLVATRDGRTVATADRYGAIRLWDATTGRERGRLEVPGASMGFRLLGDGVTLLSRDSDQMMRLWDLTTGRERRRFKTPFNYARVFDVSPDDKTVAAVAPEEGAKYPIALMELATGQVSHKLQGPWPLGLGFAPDGRSLVVWYHDDTVRVWDVAGGRELRQFRFDPPPGPHSGRYLAALSPDGRLLAKASDDYQTPCCLALRELAGGKVVRVIDNLPDRVSALAFSPDGRALAWCGRTDRTVHLVETATGRERHVFRGHKGASLALAFSPDGRLLISGNEDTTALVWDLAGRAGAAPGPNGLAAAWADLAGDDAARAYDAVRRLAAAPGEAVPLLRKHLPPVPVADEKRIARLIADLDSDEYAVREEASGELERLGDAAVPACRKALGEKPSAEMRQRLEKVLEREERGRWLPTGERLRQLRALEALELAGGDEARRLLEELAGGMPGAWLTEEAKAAGRRLSKR